MTNEELMALAKKARENAYSPYSCFSVGAALLCADGKVYLGCNIENASFTPTNCAERTAFFSAIADGKREFSAIAVCGGKNNSTQPSCMPCGVCRQVMSEFCDTDFAVIFEDAQGNCSSVTLGELLPFAFEL